MDTAHVALALRDATALVHVLIADTAIAHGIRVLSIKGEVADAYRLRGPRQAADADVMVDPDRFEELCLVIESAGWHRRVERATPAILDPHSRTYIHPNWPCDIDVHISFPGFFATPKDAFERLWSTRGSLRLAHRDVSIPSLGASAVIGALHAARHTRSARHQDESEQILRKLIEEFSERDRAEFYDVARAGRSLWVLAEVIEKSAVGPVEMDATAEQRRRWTLNRHFVEDGSTVGWIIGMRQAAWFRKPIVLVRALWMPRSEIPRNDAHRMPTIREAWAHRGRRWIRGGRAMVRYLALRRRADLTR